MIREEAIQVLESMKSEENYKGGEKHDYTY